MRVSGIPQRTRDTEQYAETGNRAAIRYKRSIPEQIRDYVETARVRRTILVADEHDEHQLYECKPAPETVTKGPTHRIGTVAMLAHVPGHLKNSFAW